MPGHVNTFWTDDRIDKTINQEYILDQLKPDERPLLDRTLSFGEGLTDDTYLDWILTRARRFFLILVDVGVPDQIFGVVDESYDDSDLPIAADRVAALRLSYHPDKALDKKFYNAQFRFLVKDIRAGEHVSFGLDELIPVESIASKSAATLLGKDDADRVILPDSTTRLYTRIKVALDEPPAFIQETDVLTEIIALAQYSHPHIASIYASYAEASNIHVLLTPAPEYNLKAFFQDSPKQWDSLAKPRRRETLLKWPHCLASALSWLHLQGRAHGALRPSNIFLDAEFRIFLGQLDTGKLLQRNFKVDDIEAYQYAAPERWKRAATAQYTGAAKTLGNSGGRTARKPVTAARPQSSSSRQSSHSAQPTPVNTLKPTDTAVPFIPLAKSRIRLSNYRPTSSRNTGNRANNNESWPPLSPSTTKSSSTNSGSSMSQSQRQSRISAISSAPSATSSSSSKSARTLQIQPTPIPEPIVVPAPETRTAIVQTWQSTEHDPFPADIFSFGAISLDIISNLCKRSPSAFARHRSAKNRTAGRGGGLADASFHANIGQLYSWCKTLDQDARKKIGKNEASNDVFAAVKPMLEVIIQCIDKDPSARRSAETIEAKLANCMLHYAKIECSQCNVFQSESEKGRSHAEMDLASNSDRSSLVSPTYSRESAWVEHIGKTTVGYRGIDDNDENQQDSRATQRRQRLREKLGLPSEPSISPTSPGGKPIDAASPYGYLPLGNGNPNRSGTSTVGSTHRQIDLRGARHRQHSEDANDDSASMITIETVKAIPTILQPDEGSGDQLDEAVLPMQNGHILSPRQGWKSHVVDPHPGNRVSLVSYDSSFDALSSTDGSNESHMGSSDSSHFSWGWGSTDHKGDGARESSKRSTFSSHGTDHRTEADWSEQDEADYDQETSETADGMMDFLSRTTTTQSASMSIISRKSSAA